MSSPSISATFCRFFPVGLDVPFSQFLIDVSLTPTCLLRSFALMSFSSSARIRIGLMSISSFPFLLNDLLYFVDVNGLNGSLTPLLLPCVQSITLHPRLCPVISR